MKGRNCLFNLRMQIVRCFSLLFLFPGTLLSAATAPLQEFKNATFVSAEYNDGDSFAVRFEHDGKTEEHVVRLYFVDAFESKTDSDSDRQRLREQTRYFGFESENRKRGSEFGKRAAVRVSKLLSKPFTIYTAFKLAQGRSKKPRIYVMITTSDGKDLAKILVQEGLARAYGIGRKLPDGISAKDYREHLRDVELEAAVKKRGAWELANFDRIVEVREEFRREKRVGDAEVTAGETAEREEREEKSD